MAGEEGGKFSKIDRSFDGTKYSTRIAESKGFVTVTVVVLVQTFSTTPPEMNHRGRRPMVHPASQTVTAKEGESLNIVVEFCAEPMYTKVLWMSKENVYMPGAEARDGVQALAIESPTLCESMRNLTVLPARLSGSILIFRERKLVGIAGGRYRHSARHSKQNLGQNNYAHRNTCTRLGVSSFFTPQTDGGTESCYRTVLSFDTIQWSHAGEWLLLVRSSEGISDASVLLNMTRASEYSHAHFRSASLTCLSMCLALVILQQHRR
ncbi:hypothetical protein WN48_09598 [Eufriesea mexicana]|uniref:Uncharacterized protein n=1 Tax=Eufriesea mexicana TaxID=516756 RepID=A0A310S757_9HYME|nr:hypothetical protein WN48_09598 [Eufriesea mexicana]